MKNLNLIKCMRVGGLLGFLVVFLLIMPIGRTSGAAVVPWKANSGETQAAWEVYSPADNSFKIDLPGKPLYTNTLLRGRDASEEFDRSFFKCTKKLDVYYLKDNSEVEDDSESRNEFFGLIVFDVSGCRRSRKQFFKELPMLFFVFGGDSKKVLKDEFFKINELDGRKFVFEFGETKGTVVAANGGKRIFVLYYDAANRDPAELARILGSFQPKALK